MHPIDFPDPPTKQLPRPWGIRSSAKAGFIVGVCSAGMRINQAEVLLKKLHGSPADLFQTPAQFLYWTGVLLQIPIWAAIFVGVAKVRNRLFVPKALRYPK